MPIQNPRIQDYVAAATDDVVISAPTVYDPTTGIPIPSTTTIVLEDGVTQVTTQVLGKPNGLAQGAIMPLINNVSYDVVLNPLSVSSFGTSTITVTFSSPHGLATNDQIAVEGLSNNLANGFYSVTVTSAIAFTYQVNAAVPASGLLQGTTLMVTGLAGLPYNYAQIPLTGV